MVTSVTVKFLIISLVVVITGGTDVISTIMWSAQLFYLDRFLLKTIIKMSEISKPSPKT